MMKGILRSLMVVCGFAALASAQVNEGFESGLPTAAPSTPASYSLASGTWTILKGVRTTTKHGGTYAINLNNGSTTASYADAPAVSGVTNVSFWARGSGASTMRLFTSVDGGAFVQVSTLSITSSYAAYTVPVNQAGSVRVRFQNSTSQTHYIDDVVVSGGGATTPTPTPTPTPSTTPTTRPTCGPRPTLPGPAPTPRAVPGDNQVQLTWGGNIATPTSVPGAWTPQSYTLKRRVGTSGTYTVLFTGGNGSYIDTAVTNGTTYQYVVAVTWRYTFPCPEQGPITGTTPDSAPVTVTPMAGTTPTPTSTPTSTPTPTVTPTCGPRPTLPAPAPTPRAVPGDNQVSLIWASNITNPGSTSPGWIPQAYNLKRRTGTSGTYAVIFTGTEGSYNDTTVTNGTTYQYVVSVTWKYNYPCPIPPIIGTTPDSAPVTVTPVAPTPRPRITPTPPGPVGFASLNALGQNGTTGGGGGPTVTATSAGQLADYVSRQGPLIVQVSGTITISSPANLGMLNVSSDKTIQGIGSTGAIVGGGFNIGHAINDAVTSPPADAIKNVIIRNLSCSGAADDCINIQMFAHHVWVDHNDLSDSTDGLVDVKRGADYVTISWNHFHDHDKTSLVGHSDNAGAQDTGRLHVTYYNNWFHDTITRHPRVRFAKPVHVFNNYYQNIQDYGIAGAMDAEILVEGNYFSNASEPTNPSQFGESCIHERNNIYAENSDGPGTNCTAVTEPSTFYNYTAQPAAGIPAIVTAGAGVGKLGL